MVFLCACGSRVPCGCLAGITFEWAFDTYLNGKYDVGENVWSGLQYKDL